MESLAALYIRVCWHRYQAFQQEVAEKKQRLLLQSYIWD